MIEHKQQSNAEDWIGTEMQVLVAGNWTTYKSRVVQYLQQLAIITPYARLEMAYSNRSDEKKGMNLRFERRSEQMPAQAKEVKHHPSSVSPISNECDLLTSVNCTVSFGSLFPSHVIDFRSTISLSNSYWNEAITKHSSNF